MVKLSMTSPERTFDEMLLGFVVRYHRMRFYLSFLCCRSHGLRYSPKQTLSAVEENNLVVGQFMSISLQHCFVKP